MWITDLFLSTIAYNIKLKKNKLFWSKLCLHVNWEINKNNLAKQVKF